jgi:3-methyladenine DNA glycosylase/8-oxoguanine DNA glycosylase
MIQIIESTREYWTLPVKTQFHHIVSQYVTKMVRFSESRKIRKNLYLLLGDPYSQDIFNSSSSEDLIRCNLSNEQIITLRYISSIINEREDLEVNLQRLSLIKGVGPWTIKSIRLMMTNDNTIFLYEDSYIRDRLAELYNLDKLTQTQAKEIALKWENYQSCLSKFLWRIKKSGIQKIKAGIILTKGDFL